MTDHISNTVRVLLSLNRAIVDKNIGGNKLHFSSGWEPHNLALAEMAEAIDAGFAFAPQFKDGKRLGVNFEATGFIAIDSDGTLSLEQALADPFIEQYAALWYTTASHGEDELDRFRIVFVTEAPIIKADCYRAALLGLAKRFGTDHKIADGARCFYGSRGSHPTILGNILPDDELKGLIREGRAADEARRSQRVATEDTRSDEREIDGSARANITIPDGLEIRLAHGGVGTIRTIPPRAAVHCPYHDDANPSAFTLRSKKGDPGVHCLACKKTWWAKDLEPPTYDFYYYDKFVQDMAVKIPQWNTARMKRGEAPSNKEAIVLETEYLPPIGLQDGVTLVKSPKGTGKTTALKKLVAEAKAKGKSVLLIGHRVILLRELATKLGLDCYLDDGDLGGEFGYTRPDHYAVSIDSLPRRLFQPRPYDIIIIDECEQVFRHVIAKTVKNPNAVMTRLLSYIGDSQSLYLLDADLNQVTMHFVFGERAKDKAAPVRMVLNTYVAENRPCDLYDRPEDLIVDMIQAVRAGKRLFVACNSKRRAKLLARVIAKELGGKNEKVLLITADEKVSQDVQDFLADIPTKYLQYQAVVASPAIGTGIDITFPGHAREVDVAYGFFNSGINSHYDVDQQLGRVRDPGEVKVWVCNRKNFFEIEIDAVKLDLVQTGDAHPAVKGYSRGVPIIDMDHPLLTLQATAYSAERASHNRMRHYFLRHKELNGCDLLPVMPSFMGRVCSGYAPGWGLLQTRSV
jgi:hypothetical protein